MSLEDNGTHEAGGAVRRSQVQLLSDLPVSDDAFGTRESVAMAIAGVVAEQGGGGAIGLEGGWGSGKSSIVEMVKERLRIAARERVAVMTFDAWSHRGDPLRLSFIRELFDHLKCVRWLDEDQCKTLERQLVELSFTTTSKSVQPGRWTRSDRIVATLALLTAPPGLAMLGSGIDGWMLWGLLVTTFGVAAFGSMWAVYGVGRIVRWCADRAPRMARTRFGKAAIQLAAAHNVPPDERFRVSESGLDLSENDDRGRQDRTSLEFADAFNAIAGLALKDGARRLLIVIDNLDRLNADEVLDAWSTMRLFTDHQATPLDSMSEWRSRVWLLVPYDPSGLRPLLTRSRVDRSMSADSVLEKTFRVRFEAPQLLLLDWQSYLRTLLCQAMPGFANPAEQYDDAVRVAAYAFAKDGRAPTPRQLRMLVNDAAAIVAVRGDSDSVPLAHILCYVWARRRFRTERCMREELLEPTVIRSVVAESSESDGMLNLTMLLFGTPDREKAAELLLYQPLVEALGQANGQALAKLSQSAVFWPAFDLLDHHRFPLSNEFSPTALSAIAASRIVDAPYRSARTIVERLARRFCEYSFRDCINRVDGDALCAALMVLRSERHARTILRRLSEHGVRGGKPPAVHSELPDWACDHAYSVASVAAAARDHAQVVDPLSLVELRGPDEPLLAVVAALRSECARCGLPVKSLQIQISDQASWSALLAPSVSRMPWLQWRTDAIVLCDTLGMRLDWRVFAAGIVEVVTRTEVTDKRVWLALLELVELIVCRQPELVPNLLDPLVETGRVAMAMAALPDAPEHRARWLALGMTRRPPLELVALGPQSPVAQASAKLLAKGEAGPAEVAALAGAIEKLKTPDPLSKLLTVSDQYAPLISALLRMWTSSPYLEQLISIPSVMKRWGTIRRLIGASSVAGDGAGALLARLWPCEEFQRKLEETTVKNRDQIWLDALANDIVTGQSRSFLERSLHEVNQLEWASELASSGSLIDIAAAAAKSKVSIRLLAPAQKAITDCAKRLAGGEGIWSEQQWPRIAAFVEALSTDHLKVVGIDILRQIENGQLAMPEVRQQCFQAALTAALADVDGDDFLRGAGKTIADADDAKWLSWLASILEKHEHLWSSAMPAVRTVFIEQLDTKGKVGSPTSEGAVHLAQRLRDA